MDAESRERFLVLGPTKLSVGPDVESGKISTTGSPKLFPLMAEQGDAEQGWGRQCISYLSPTFFLQMVTYGGCSRT